MSGNILKVLIALLLLGNVGYLGYQGYVYLTDISELKDNVGRSEKLLVRIKERQLRYQRDLNQIVRNGYVKVDNVTVALANHARALDIRDDRDEIFIPIKPKTEKGGKQYIQDVWKITFDRRKRYSARTLAKFARNIERDLPGYQIKSLDFGIRSETWNEDLWAAKELVVRRFKRKEARK